DDDAIAYCERFLEFLIDLEAQLPTRRYFNTLIDDHQILVLCKLSPLVKRKEGSELFKQLLEILKFYAGFEIHDHTGLALTDDQMTELH
ncbi:18257_t:CDS:2, partial [Cetraspora pellucida]